MSDDTEDNSAIIRATKRRLQALKLREAQYGINAPPEVSMEIEDLEKKLRQLQQTEQAQIQVPVQPTQGQRLAFAQKKELISALLACSSISDRSNRNAILRQLSPDIFSRIVDDNRPNVHVLNIVDTCLTFSGGLEELIEVLRDFEGPSLQMQALDAVLSRIMPDFPKI